MLETIYYQIIYLYDLVIGSFLILFSKYIAQKSIAVKIFHLFRKFLILVTAGLMLSLCSYVAWRKKTASWFIKKILCSLIKFFGIAYFFLATPYYFACSFIFWLTATIILYMLPGETYEQYCKRKVYQGQLREYNWAKKYGIEKLLYEDGLPPKKPEDIIDRLLAPSRLFLFFKKVKQLISVWIRPLTLIFRDKWKKFVDILNNWRR